MPEKEPEVEGQLLKSLMHELHYRLKVPIAEEMLDYATHAAEAGYSPAICQLRVQSDEC